MIFSINEIAFSHFQRSQAIAAFDTLANIAIYPTSDSQFALDKERASRAVNLFLDGGRVASFSAFELHTVAPVVVSRRD